MRTIGRVAKYGEPLTERVQVLFTGTQIEALEKKYGSELASAIREIMLGERVLDAPEPPANEVRLELDGAKRAQLEELAKKLRYRELHHFIEDLALRALEMPTGEVLSYLHGNLDAKPAAQESREARARKIVEEKRAKKTDKVA